MRQRIKLFTTLAMSLLMLGSAVGGWAQENANRRLVHVWFDQAPEGGMVVVKQGTRILRDGDAVHNGSTLLIEASVAQRDYSLAVLRVSGKHYVNLPVQSVSVKYKVEGDTHIKAIFSQIQSANKATLDIKKNQGGTLEVYVGDREVLTGEHVPVGTVLRIRAISGKSFVLSNLTAQRGQCLIDETYTNNPIEVFYRVSEAYTLIKAYFEHWSSLDRVHVPLYISESGKGGLLYVFLGERQVYTGDLVPLRGTLTLKAIPERYGWLTQLTIGDEAIISEPICTPFTYRHTIETTVYVRAKFSPTPPSSDRGKGDAPMNNEEIGLEGAAPYAYFSWAREDSAFVIARAKADVSVQLYNMNGHLMRQERTDANGTCRLSTEGLATGTYLLRVGNVVKKVLVK